MFDVRNMENEPIKLIKKLELNVLFGEILYMTMVTFLNITE